MNPPRPLRRLRNLLGTALCTTAAWPALAAAQVGPGPTGMPAGGVGEQEEKPAGVAEAAPRTPGALPTTQPLPPPRNKRSRFQLFELDGYLRFRGDYFKNLNLSFRDDDALGGSPFPRPISCAAASTGSPGAVGRPCGDTLKSSNLRLRAMPKISVSETLSVHTEIDVLDNVVLGSTPSSATSDATLGAFSDTQAAPQAGDNWQEDALRVSRAWAEAETPLGLLKFGRMPDHWGLGIAANSGAEDPVNGGVDLDADYGDTVDRLMFATRIPGTRLRGAVATDWASTAPASTQTGGERGGQAFDLEDSDDVSQWSFWLSRMDTPEEFRDVVERGELAINAGVYFRYRTQSWDYAGAALGEPVDADALVPRDATLYIPDVWVRLAKGNLQLEAEAVAVFGSINQASDLGLEDELSVRQFGAVGRLTARAMNDKLRFGVELGAASGDQYDTDPQGSGHVSDARDLPDPGDDDLTWFRFDPDYKVDLILWRELVGQVTNAVYGKPFLSYELTDAIDLKVANITSFALKPVATPGNGSVYGTEFDADLGYSSDGFQAGIAYGVFFPLSAMDHPLDALGEGGEGFNYGANAGDAGNAHTLQARLVVTF